ncbi:MAG: hypothetical protein LC118_13650 [Dehalococcoidia bacterium]|nr:hypothetical protein [Dehalococcoidia bacterium]
MSAGTSGNGTRPSAREPEPAEGLRLRALPAAGERAFPLEHEYFEVVYAPLIGPTAVLLARAMARHLQAAGGPTTVCPVELAMEVGIRASNTDPLGKKSHLVHAIDRLAHDRIVSRLGDRVLGVRVAIPPLSARALEKLPTAARVAHDALVLTSEQDDVGSP